MHQTRIHNTIINGWGAMRSREECLEEAMRCEREAHASPDTRLSDLLLKMAQQWRRLAARQQAALLRPNQVDHRSRFDVV